MNEIRNVDFSVAMKLAADKYLDSEEAFLRDAVEMPVTDTVSGKIIKNNGKEKKPMKIKLKKTLKIALIAAMSMITVFSAVAMAKEPVRDALVESFKILRDKTTVILNDKNEKALPKSDDRTEYVDADGNNYFFSPDGELSGFIRSNDYELPLDEESVSTISAEEARAKADEHIIAVYGEDVLSAFDKCSVEDSLTGPLYIVTYEVKAGIDDIIDVCRCRVHVVKENGEVYGSALNFYYENKDFDLSELSDISKKDIEAFAEKEAKNVYGDTVKNIEIQGVQLICEDGIYKIRVAAAFNFTDKDGNDDYTDEIVFFPI